MSYYFSKVLKGKGFDEAIELVTAGLKTEGFGILSEINVSETLKNRIGVDFRKYKILGACNPHFAHKALTAEDKVGVFLPCNVVVQEHENGLVEVTAVDPVASMMSIENPALTPLAGEVKQKLKRVIDAL
jgi:uncharacterized protein (DUF302 family)